MVPAGAVGDGFNRKRLAACQWHGLKPLICAPPKARGLGNVARLVKLVVCNHASSTVDRFLAADQLASDVIPDLHGQACWCVAVKVSGSNVQRGRGLLRCRKLHHTPDRMRAVFRCSSRFALRDIVLANKRTDGPHRPRVYNDVPLWCVRLEVEPVFLVIDQRLVRPRLRLVGIKQRPHVLADLEAADVRAHVACWVFVGEHGLSWLRATPVYKPKLLPGWLRMEVGVGDGGKEVTFGVEV